MSRIPTVKSKLLIDTLKVSRDSAIDSGLVRYFTGEICPHGHIDERYTLNGYCVECQRETNKKNRALINFYRGMSNA